LPLPRHVRINQRLTRVIFFKKKILTQMFDLTRWFWVVHV